MIKALAAAFVLILVAAIVLWFGNTLNSWVLGGLIGGLAALLLSIPISLVFFSFFARRHDEHLRADAYEQAQYDYPPLPRRVRRKARQRVVYDEYEGYEQEEEYEEYAVPGEVYEIMEEDERRSHRVVWEDERPLPPSRQLPPVASAKRLPAPRATQRPSTQLPAATSRNDGVSQRPAASRRDEDDAPSRQQPARRKEGGETRSPSRRPASYPAFPGYQADPFRTRYRSQALRTARLEASQQRVDDEEDEIPAPTLSRRVPPARSSRPLLPASESPAYKDTEYPQFGSEPRQYQRRPRRIVDASASEYDARRTLPEYEEHTAYRTQDVTQADGYEEPETESLDELHRPMLRRAPYLYDDDPYLKEMAQQLERPIIRRSSRYLERRQERQDREER